MAALVSPDHLQIIATLCPGGVASQFGTWTAEDIRLFLADTNNLLNPIAEEYNYAVDLILAGGLDDQDLSATNYPIATRAMMYAIAYRLLQMDLASSEQMAAEPNQGINRKEIGMKMDTYYRLAGLEWLKMGIESKYHIKATIGYADTGFVQNSCNNRY